MVDNKEKTQGGERDIKKPEIYIINRAKVLEALMALRDEAFKEWVVSREDGDITHWIGFEVGVNEAIQAVKNIKGVWK